MEETPEETIEALEKEVSRLVDRVEDLEDENTELQDKVDTLRDEADTLTGELENERDLNEAARLLVRALDTYLSWVDSPPPGMSERDQARYLADFRRNLDDARREITE